MSINFKRLFRIAFGIGVWLFIANRRRIRRRRANNVTGTTDARSPARTLDMNETIINHPGLLDHDKPPGIIGSRTTSKDESDASRRLM